MSMKEYIVPIRGDISQLEKVVHDASGQVKRLTDEDVLIKVNYDGNIAQYNQLFEKIIKSTPELTVQFQYDVNKKILEQEINKLNSLGVDIDLGNAQAKLKTLSELISSVYQKWSDAMEDEEQERLGNELTKLVQKMVNYREELGKLGSDGTKAYSSISKEVRNIVDEISKQEELTPKLIDEKAVSKQQDLINEIKSNLEKLREMGAQDVSVGDSGEIETLKQNIEKINEEIADIREQMNGVSGDLFKSMQQDVDGLNERLSEMLEKLERLQNPDKYELGGMISEWHNRGIQEKERYTPFNSRSMQVSDSSLEGEMEKISGEMVRKAIENSKIAIDGFIHSHPTVKAAFSDNDLEMYFALMQNGITKQVVTSLKENMMLDMSLVDTTKQSDIMEAIREFYSKIDEEIESSFLNSRLDDAQEIGNVVLNGVQTSSPVLQEVVKNAKTEFNKIFERIGESATWDEYIDAVDLAMDEAIKQSQTTKSLSKESKQKVVRLMGDISRNMTDPLLEQMRDQAQAEYQKVLLDVFRNPNFLKDGAASAIKVQNIGELIDFSSIKNAVGKELKDAIAEGLANGIDAHSDSRKSIQSGQNFVNGLTHSIEEHTSEAVAAAEHLGEAVSEALDESLESVKDGEIVLNVNDKNSISSPALDKKVAEIQYLYDKIRSIYDGPDGIINEDMSYAEKFNSSEVQQLITLLSQLSDAELEALNVAHGEEWINEFRYNFSSYIEMIKEVQAERQKAIEGTSDEDEDELDMHIWRHLESIYDTAQKGEFF